MSPQDRIRNARIALAALDALRRRLIARVETSDQVGRTGWLSVARGELTARCLGRALRSRSRPVAKNGRVIAYEYAFIGQDDASVGPWLAARIYLTKSARLRARSPRGAVVCDLDDDALVPLLTDAVANEMLGSEAFAP